MRRMQQAQVSLVALAGLLIVPACRTTAPKAAAVLMITAVDATTGREFAVRMHLKDADGQEIVPQTAPAAFPSGTVAWKDHFVFDGSVKIHLPAGRYTYEIEHGPEYRLVKGSVTLLPGAEQARVHTLHRFVDMKRDGWWSGELHVHRPLADVELLMRAEDLHVAPIITWWNEQNRWQNTPIPDQLLVRFDTNRFYHLMAGEDERQGGALLYFNLQQPLPIQVAKKEYPSPVEFLEMARAQVGAHIDVEKPFWWDVPVWVATGKVDSIGLANNHLYRDGVYPDEAWGRPRDQSEFPSPHGNGKWSQSIYYHLLNCGLRIAPSAGSASGVLANPVGYNRVYVFCGEQLTYQRWWDGLRAGRVVVTNGPMLRPSVNGQLPGHVFRGVAGKTIVLQPKVAVSLRDKVESLEIVKDGEVVERVRLTDLERAHGRLPDVEFERSGWMLVRAVTDKPETYRFAMTGPFYVEIDGRRRVSRRSAQFFLDWVNERAEQIQLKDADQLASVMRTHRSARRYWQDLVKAANSR
ncbi:MAG: CehA/McbA family metallohydrolase [Planctomycetota bacterium]|nr:CehA/McbA family metallohydrolase [Planctomycetota bacterium]